MLSHRSSRIDVSVRTYSGGVRTPASQLRVRQGRQRQNESFLKHGAECAHEANPSSRVAPMVGDAAVGCGRGGHVCVFAGVGGIAGYFRDLDERRYQQLSYRARISAEELETLERAFAC